jgi:hypothetical protein
MNYERHSIQILSGDPILIFQQIATFLNRNHCRPDAQVTQRILIEPTFGSNYHFHQDMRTALEDPDAGLAALSGATGSCYVAWSTAGAAVLARTKSPEGLLNEDVVDIPPEIILSPSQMKETQIGQAVRWGSRPEGADATGTPSQWYNNKAQMDDPTPGTCAINRHHRMFYRGALIARDHGICGEVRPDQWVSVGFEEMVFAKVENDHIHEGDDLFTYDHLAIRRFKINIVRV